MFGTQPLYFYLSACNKHDGLHYYRNVSSKVTSLSLSSSVVLVADSSGDGGFPEEARRVLRGSEAVPEECLHSERLLSVSLTTAPRFHNCAAAAAAECCTITLLIFNI